MSTTPNPYYQSSITLEPNSRILVVDDNEAIHHDFRKIFGGSSPDEDEFEAAAAQMLGEAPSGLRCEKHYDLTFAQQGVDAVELVRQSVAAGKRYAMAFMDVRMPPGLDGIETTLKLWDVDPEVQVVICTAYSDYSWDEMKSMIPYPERLLILKKPFDSIEVLQFAHALTEKWALMQAAQRNIDELNRIVNERTWEMKSVVASLEAEIAAHKAAKHKVRRQATLLEKGRDAIMVRDIDDTIISWNHGAEALYGWKAEDALGRRVSDFLCASECDTAAWEARQAVIEDRYWRGRLNRKRRDGTEVLVECFWTLVMHDNGSPRSIIEVNSDIEARADQEAEILRAERLEGIGSLAAGIAHDLSNLLAPVQFGATALVESHPEGPDKTIIDGILISANRAMDVVKQIVHFARGVRLNPEATTAGTMIHEFEALFRAGLRPNIVLTVCDEAAAMEVTADRVQMGQVLLNLCVNACDAMDNGGSLTISTREVTIDKGYAAAVWGLEPGRYVRIDIADTGCGIPAAVKSHIFEPFFTTKAGSGGSGLGLATVFGILNHHHGAITVDSEEGHGTTFHLYLPERQIEEAPELVEDELIPIGAICVTPATVA